MSYVLRHSDLATTTICAKVDLGRLRQARGVAGDGTMKMLAQHLDEYRQLCRTLGHKLAGAHRLLPRFVAHLDEQGAEFVTIEAGVCVVARAGGAGRECRAGRPDDARPRRRSLLSEIHQRTEVPPAKAKHFSADLTAAAMIDRLVRHAEIVALKETATASKTSTEPPHRIRPPRQAATLRRPTGSPRRSPPVVHRRLAETTAGPGFQTARRGQISSGLDTPSSPSRRVDHRCAASTGMHTRMRSCSCPMSHVPCPLRST